MTGAQTRLASGVRVVRTAARHGQAASALAFLEAGSWSDPIGRSGLAHLYEHGFFAGAGELPTAAAIAAAVDGLGCTTNAVTRGEYSYFHVSGPYTTRRRALDLLLTCFRAPCWNPDELRKQRAAMAAELRLFADSPQRRLRELANVALHGPGQFGRNPLGDLDEIGRLERDDVAWFAAHVADPSRVIIAVDSPVEDDNLDTLLAGHLDYISTVDAPTAAAPGRYGPPVNLHLRYDTKVALVALVVPGVSYQMTLREMYAMRLMHTILGGGRSSRLVALLRDRLGLSYQARTALEPHAETGALLVVFGCAPESVRDAVTAVYPLVEQALAERPSPDELARAVEINRGTHVRERETAAGRCLSAAHETFRRGGAATDEELFDTWGAIGADEVLEVANRALRLADARCVVVGPGDAPGDLAGLTVLAGPWRGVESGP